jgi:hypothetical protein
MKSLLRIVQDGGHQYEVVMYWCPARYAPPVGRDEGHECGLHMLPVGGDTTRAKWELHSLDPLHIEPSVLSYWIGGQRCHSFVRGGMIEFLGDSTHDLAGQTVPVPDLPDWITDESREEWND